MKAFEYAAPESLADALRTLRAARTQSVRPLAGGTDLLPLIKADIEAPHTLMNLKRLRDLPRGIELDGEEASLGALASLADIARHPQIARSFPALAQAALSAATPQLRNMATLGGTLLQRPRCWYFRSPHFRCWLKGGSACDAREGQNQFHAVFDTGVCRAVHPSDLACALVLFDARIRVRGPRGERTLAVSEFFAPPEDARRTETVLAEDELVVAVHLPAPPHRAASVYVKAMDRAAWAFATVSVAASMRCEDDRIAAVSVVLGGVATVPWPLTAGLQQLVGASPSDDAAITAAARTALSAAEPLRMNAYKVPLAQSLIRRALSFLAPAP